MIVIVLLIAILICMAILIKNFYADIVKITFLFGILGIIGFSFFGIDAYNQIMVPLSQEESTKLTFGKNTKIFSKNDEGCTVYKFKDDGFFEFSRYFVSCEKEKVNTSI